MVKSNIEWTDYTHNFWSGCQKVSEGCKYCYMHRIIDGRGGNPNKVQRANDDYFYKPYYEKTPKMIFTCSMSDFFIPEADEWRARAWATIKNTPWHTWQILTKRPERVAECLPDDWGDGYPNVWLGVSVENQKNFHRIATLAEVPAAIRFVSIEPLIDEIDILIRASSGKLLIEPYQWIIIGGESGMVKGKYKFRACKVEWMEKIVTDVKQNTDIKIFVKQMGTALAKQGIGSCISHQGYISSWHGELIDKFPKSLQIREMPEVVQV